MAAGHEDPSILEIRSRVSVRGGERCRPGIARRRNIERGFPVGKATTIGLNEVCNPSERTMVEMIDYGWLFWALVILLFGETWLRALVMDRAELRLPGISERRPCAGDS